jgi:uncharacterized protein (UPF0147 family)
MFGLGGNHSGGASYYDGVTAYTPQDTFANTWAGNTFGGGGGGYDPISSFDLGGYAVNSVDRFADYNLPADNYILLPEVQNDLFGTTTDSFDWMNGVMNTGGDYDPSWFTNNFDTGTDTLTNTNFFENENLTLEEAGILEDITSINQTEQNILEDYGLLTYNDDGSVNFDSNEAIAALGEVANDPNLSNWERSQITNTASQLASAADAGLDYFDFTSPDVASGVYSNEAQDAYAESQIPLGAYSYNTIEGQKYVDPMSNMYIPQGTMVAGPEGNTPFIGSLIASGINNIGAKKGYVSDPATNGGYVFPRQTQNIGQALNDPMSISSGAAARATARSRIAGDRYGFNEYGEPNQMVNGVRYAGTPTFYDKVDSFTDGIRDFGGMLLKPLNFVTDTVGGGLASVGQAVGDNFLGRGILNMGNVIDGSGDYLFGSSDRNSLLGTVMGVPDSVALMGQGLAYGNLGMAGQGLKGLVGAPLSVLGNALSMPLSVARDVFGADITIGAGGGGGGGKKKKKKKKARKNVPIVGNKRGLGNGVQNQGTGSGGGETTTTEDGTEYDLSDLGDRNDFADQYGEGALAQRMSDLNLKSTGARANANADTLETSDADRSQVAESIGANQGNRTSVKKAPTVESADVLDEMVGAGDAVDIQEAIEDNSTGFKTSDLFENEQQPIFAYEEEEAFA